jgi:murein DD-endopeptidase MepM/ murein hydrolase activator NlpD
MEVKIIKPFKGEFPVSQGFGEAGEWYVKIAGYPHNGIDFAMPIGIPILACDNGVLTYADNVPDSDGCGINIKHEWGMSQYWHLSGLVAKYGEKVVKEQKIGLSGATGWATGPHLHFGIKVNGQGALNMRGWTDPKPFFENEILPEPATQNATRSHQVARGETLWGIAEKYYGKGFLWPKIYEANKNVIKNPSLIYSGQKFLIP